MGQKITIKKKKYFAIRGAIANLFAKIFKRK